MAPGEYKDRPNRAGMTFFVHPDLVRGTLREGFRIGQSLREGLPRAIFWMFLVAEVHPFADGNGRVARLLMNAELTAVDQSRVMIPLPYRDDYFASLRALRYNNNATPLRRMIDRAQRWSSAIDWTDRGGVLDQLRRTNALVTPDEAKSLNLRLLDP